MQGDYLAKDLRMVVYLDEVRVMLIKIGNFKIYQILREEIGKADALANLVSAFDFVWDRSVPLEFLPNLSIEIVKDVCRAEADPT